MKGLRSLLRRAWRMPTVRRIAVVLFLLVAYQVWLGIQATGKVAPGVGDERDARGRFTVNVELGFPRSATTFWSCRSTAASPARTETPCGCARCHQPASRRWRGSTGSTGSPHPVSDREAAVGRVGRRSSGEEVGQHRGELLRRLLGHVVPGVRRRPGHGRSPPPGRGRVRRAAPPRPRPSPVWRTWRVPGRSAASTSRRNRAGPGRSRCAGRPAAGRPGARWRGYAGARRTWPTGARTRPGGNLSRAPSRRRPRPAAARRAPPGAAAAGRDGTRPSRYAG